LQNFLSTWFAPTHDQPASPRSCHRGAAIGWRQGTTPSIVASAAPLAHRNLPILGLFGCSCHGL